MSFEKFNDAKEIKLLLNFEAPFLNIRFLKNTILSAR